MGNNKITNLADPIDSLDAANKKYVDVNSPLIFEKIVSNHSLNGGKNVMRIHYSLSTYLDIVGFLYKVDNYHDSQNSNASVCAGNASSSNFNIVESSTTATLSGSRLFWCYIKRPASYYEFESPSGSNSSSTLYSESTKDLYVYRSSTSASGTISIWAIRRNVT